MRKIVAALLLAALLCLPTGGSGEEIDLNPAPSPAPEPASDPAPVSAAPLMEAPPFQAECAALLLMEAEDIPEGLRPFLPEIQAFEPIRRRLGLSRFEFHLRYNLSRPRISHVLFGVLDNAQLEGNIRAAEAGPLPPDVMAEIEAMRRPLPETLIRPSCWPRKA